MNPTASSSPCSLTRRGFLHATARAATAPGAVTPAPFISRGQVQVVLNLAMLCFRRRQVATFNPAQQEIILGSSEGA